MTALLSSISFMRVKKMGKSFVSSNLPTKSNVENFWYFSQGYRRITRNTFAFVRRIKNNETFVEFFRG
jgi:hypothetical protein